MLSARGDGGPGRFMDTPALIFKGKNLFFYLTVGTMLIPGEATLLTNYETISKLHMINTYQGIIIMFIGSATSVFIMRQYFSGSLGFYKRSV